MYELCSIGYVKKKKVTNKQQLHKKLGYSPLHSESSRLIKAKEDREKFALKADITKSTICDSVT